MPTRRGCSVAPGFFFARSGAPGCERKRGREAARGFRRLAPKAGERCFQGPGEVFELGLESDRPAALRVLPLSIRPLEEEPQVVPPADHVLSSSLSLHGRLEFGAAARDEVFREIPGPLYPEPVAVQAPLIALRGSLRERSLRLFPLVEKPLQRAGGDPSGESSKLLQQAPEPLLVSAGPGCCGVRRLPADLERGRGVVREEPEVSDPGEKRAVHLPLAVRRKAANDLAGPALDLAPPERARRRGDPAQRDAQVVKALGVTGAQPLARPDEGTPSKLPERGGVGQRALL